MAINLSRNTKVYFTTNVSAATGIITDANSGFTASNTFEVQVQDGYSFAQTTNQTTIQVSEAGSTPSRGQRAFNTSLAPVDWSFSTYIRPYIASTFISPAEKVLWNALLGESTLDDTGLAITSLTRVAGTAPVIAATASPFATIVTATPIQRTVSGTAAAVVVNDVINLNGFADPSLNESVLVSAVTGTGPTTYTVEFATAPATTVVATPTVGSAKAYTGQWAKSTTANSNFSYVSTMGAGKNQLQKFGLIFVVDNAVYGVDNCALDQVSIDFGLDAIAMCAWTGKGTALKQLANIPGSALSSTGTPIATLAQTSANYITNKLSTLKLQSNIGGDEYTGSTKYTIPITGGNITIANNLNYLTPVNLAVVNTPIGYYTGQRAVTGNVTAYLRTGGTNDSGTLLSTLLAAASSTTEPKYKVQLEMGGASAANRVEFEMPGVVLQIPAVNVADIVATTINFSAQGFDPSLTTAQTFDITKNNELVIRYFSS